MDWKDLLASKVEDGTLSREEFVPQQEPSAGKAFFMCQLTGKDARARLPL